MDGSLLAVSKSHKGLPPLSGLSSGARGAAARQPMSDEPARLRRACGTDRYRLVVLSLLFNDKLSEWENYYNYHRPHGALDGQTPYERLLAKTTASVSPAS